jgi:hypothetical protein
MSVSCDLMAFHSRADARPGSATREHERARGTQHRRREDVEKLAEEPSGASAVEHQSGAEHGESPDAD